MLPFSVTLHQLFINVCMAHLIQCIRTRIDLFYASQNVWSKEVILRRCEQEIEGQFICTHIGNITFMLLITVIFFDSIAHFVGSLFPSAVKLYLTVMYTKANKIGGSSRRVHSNFLGPIKRNCIAPA